VREVTASAEALAIHRRINRTAVAYPDTCGTAELFERQAGRRPGATAVVDRDRVLTYRQLNRLANAVAWTLHENGVAPGDVVGVCVARSPGLLVTLLAILKCGAAYLPFDVRWPDSRLHEILDAAGCRAVVSDRPGAVGPRLPRHRVLAVSPADLTDASAEDFGPGVTAGPDDIAYINFTSGSTGKPKGVPIRHRSIARLVHRCRFAPLNEEAKVLQLAPVSFDAATFEIWGALLRGGTCVLYPSDFPRFSQLKRVIDHHGITVMFLTTSLFNAIVDEAPGTLARVGTILVGGEAQSPPHMAAAVRHYGSGRVINMYGPTECTTFATFYPVRHVEADEPALPIGLPIQNTRVYLVDGDRLCREGEVGEVWLAGPGLSPGYLGAPEATRDRFVVRAVAGSQEQVYRTGDRGLLRADGNIVFLGRLDDQVKINGHRVEPGEIRHHLDWHPDVRRSHVAVAQDDTGEKKLVAFVVPGNARCTSAFLREYLTERLPGYLVPSSIHLCASLPLSANGKVDGRALLALREAWAGEDGKTEQHEP
jgi:D-alanine--poly(phosphoribitol) ligase subunit 1